MRALLRYPRLRADFRLALRPPSIPLRNQFLGRWRWRPVPNRLSDTMGAAASRGATAHRRPRAIRADASLRKRRALA